MFVVGKKYKGVSTGNIRECVWVDSNEAVLKGKDGLSIATQRLQEENHPEYHEPVVQKVVRSVILAVSDRLPIAIYGHDDGRTVCGKVEFTTTDGKLTDARIVS